MLTMHSTNNVVSSCVDCHFWKSVNPKNNFNSLSSHLLKLYQHIASNYSNLRCMERQRANVFCHCQYKNQHEYTIGCIFRISRCEQICVCLFLSPQHRVYKKPKSPWAARGGCMAHYHFCFDCMSCFEPANVCNTYMCVRF